MRLERIILLLYPSAWRARYGAEMEALLDDAGIDLTGLFNLFKGAVYMQMRTNSLAKLALLWSLGGLAAGYAGSYLMTPLYVSHAVLQLSAYAPKEEVIDHFLQLQARVLSRASLETVISDKNPGFGLYRRELTRDPLEDVIDRMRRDIRIQMSANGKLVSMSFAYPDEKHPHYVLQRLVNRFMEEDRTITGARPAGFSMTELDAPTYPKLISPNRAAIASVGFGTGLVIAFVIFLSRKWKIVPQSTPLAME